MSFLGAASESGLQLLGAGTTGNPTSNLLYSSVVKERMPYPLGHRAPQKIIETADDPLFGLPHFREFWGRDGGLASGPRASSRALFPGHHSRAPPGLLQGFPGPAKREERAARLALRRVGEQHRLDLCGSRIGEPEGGRLRAEETNATDPWIPPAPSSPVVSKRQQNRFLCVAAVTLIGTDATLDHSQKVEKVY